MQAIYDTVDENPGVRASAVARLLNLSRSAVTRLLPALEEEGYLLSEDDEGGLRPFRRK
jgi:Mn-dependent DtxR family transcriptional regulator